MKESKLTAIMSFIHVTVVLSLLTFGTICLSFGVLMLPALTAAFTIGKEIIFRRFSVYGSLTGQFVSCLKGSMRTMRYFPIQLAALLQFVGIAAAGKTGMDMLVYPMVAFSALLLTLMIYTIGYHVFCKPLPDVIHAAVAMFFKLRYMLAVWVLMILLEALAGIKLLSVMLIAGAVLLLAVEIVVFIALTSYKKARGELSEEDLSLDQGFIEKL